jgi:hypothetical protein
MDLLGGSEKLEGSAQGHHVGVGWRCDLSGRPYGHTIEVFFGWLVGAMSRHQEPGFFRGRLEADLSHYRVLGGPKSAGKAYGLGESLQTANEVGQSRSVWYPLEAYGDGVVRILLRAWTGVVEGHLDLPEKANAL